MAFVAASGPKSPAPFCIDRYEASLVLVTAEGEKGFSPYEPVKERRVRAISRSAAVPQGYVSRNEALAACQESNKRLCFEDEWVAACRGARRTMFPYGDARKPRHCNDEGKSPLIRLYAARGAHAFDDQPMNDPRLNQLPDTVAPTGSYRLCTNGYGVFDMVGNLHEWIDDPAGSFRGGYYLDTRLNGDGCAYVTTVHGPGYRDYSTGFRCCREARN